MIGKKFSNDWKNRGWFSNDWKKVFQWLEKCGERRVWGNREGAAGGGKGIGENLRKRAENRRGNGIARLTEGGRRDNSRTCNAES